MIVEKIYQEYEKINLVRMLDNKIDRCSLANKCIRYLGFKKLGMLGKLTPRAYMIFKLGEMIELIVKDDILQVIKNLSDIEFEEKNLDVKVDLGEGIVLDGHLDGFIYDKANDKYGVLEIKSASDYAFDEALDGKIDEDYRVQAGLYAYALNVDFVMFIFYRKQTSHLLELVFWKNLPSNVKVQYMGNQEKDYFVLNTPLDFDFIDKVREKYRKLKEVNSIEDVFAIPIPYDYTICSNCGGSGLREYGKCRSCKGTGKKVLEDGSFYLGYPCSYCAYNMLCYPQQSVEFEGLKPKVRVR